MGSPRWWWLEREQWLEARILSGSALNGPQIDRNATHTRRRRDSPISGLFHLPRPRPQPGQDPSQGKPLAVHFKGFDYRRGRLVFEPFRVLGVRLGNGANGTIVDVGGCWPGTLGSLELRTRPTATYPSSGAYLSQCNVETGDQFPGMAPLLYTEEIAVSGEQATFDLTSSAHPDLGGPPETSCIDSPLSSAPRSLVDRVLGPANIRSETTAWVPGSSIFFKSSKIRSANTLEHTEPNLAMVVNSASNPRAQLLEEVRTTKPRHIHL